MNSDQAIATFVRENLESLTSDPFSSTDFKRLIRSFFGEKHKNRFGQPGVRDICSAVVKHLKKNGLPSGKVLGYIDSLPLFLKLDKKQRKSLGKLVESPETKSKLDPSDLALLRAGKSFEAVEKHKGKEITEKKETELSDLNREIEKKQSDYESLPSVLDNIRAEEPVFDPEIEDVKQWWERFYLIANPFPRKDGLSAIDEDLYEKAVVKTEPFLHLQKELRRNDCCLFNTAFLLSGDFGFGKTTLLDYLAYHVVQYDIISIRVTCGKAYPTASGFLDSFYSKLRTALEREAIAVCNHTRAGAVLDIEDDIMFLTDLVLGQKKAF